MDLLEAFISQEGVSGCAKILEAVREKATRPLLVRQVCEFNTFDVTLLFPERIAVLEDAIAFWDKGTLRIDLDTLVRRLQELVESTTDLSQKPECAGFMKKPTE